MLVTHSDYFPLDYSCMMTGLEGNTQTWTCLSATESISSESISWKECMKKEAWITFAIVVGVIVGVYVCIATCLCCVGLSATGPVAGGVFARFQGAGVEAGSLMAGAQSCAMGGKCCGCCGLVSIALGAGVIYTIYAAIAC